MSEPLPTFPAAPATPIKNNHLPRLPSGPPTARVPDDTPTQTRTTPRTPRPRNLGDPVRPNRFAEPTASSTLRTLGAASSAAVSSSSATASAPTSMARTPSDSRTTTTTAAAKGRAVSASASVSTTSTSRTTSASTSKSTSTTSTSSSTSRAQRSRPRPVETAVRDQASTPVRATPVRTPARSVRTSAKPTTRTPVSTLQPRTTTPTSTPPLAPNSTSTIIPASVPSTSSTTTSRPLRLPLLGPDDNVNCKRPYASTSTSPIVLPEHLSASSGSAIIENKNKRQNHSENGSWNQNTSVDVDVNAADSDVGASRGSGGIERRRRVSDRKLETGMAIRMVSGIGSGSKVQQQHQSQRRALSVRFEPSTPTPARQRPPLGEENGSRENQNGTDKENGTRSRCGCNCKSLERELVIKDRRIESLEKDVKMLEKQFRRVEKGMTMVITSLNGAKLPWARSSTLRKRYRPTGLSDRRASGDGSRQEESDGDVGAYEGEWNEGDGEEIGDEGEET